MAKKLKADAPAADECVLGNFSSTLYDDQLGESHVSLKPGAHVILPLEVADRHWRRAWRKLVILAPSRAADVENADLDAVLTTLGWTEPDGGTTALPIRGDLWFNPGPVAGEPV